MEKAKKDQTQPLNAKSFSIAELKSHVAQTRQLRHRFIKESLEACYSDKYLYDPSAGSADAESAVRFKVTFDSYSSRILLSQYRQQYLKLRNQ